MKKITYVLILTLIVASGLVFANRGIRHEIPKKPAPKVLSAAEKKAAREQWEATPEGIKYKKWEASPAGKKVFDGAAKIGKQINAFTGMEAVITSLSLPPGSRLGFGVMARINDVDYILSFMPETSNELRQLQSLKVNDRVIIKSHSVMHAPKYAYPIISGDYIERDGKMIYKRMPRKGGC